MPLPSLFDQAMLLSLLSHEAAICDHCAHLVANGSRVADLLTIGLNAIALANELQRAHTSDSQADIDLSHCARQLKAYHIGKLITLSGVKS